MSLEPDNLTWMFRVTAGLDSLSNTNGVLRLGGWEAPGVELRGHTCGHWLSGMANVIHARRNEAQQRLVPLPEERAEDYCARIYDLGAGKIKVQITGESLCPAPLGTRAERDKREG